jgi:hypothetical protein
LVSPPGSDFVIDFFNDLERDKWWLDAVKPIQALIWYSFAIDFRFAARVLVKFLPAAPSLILGSFATEAEDAGGAQLDVLRWQLEDEAEVATLGERYASDVAFRRELDARLAQLMSVAGVSPTGVLPGGLRAVGGRDLPQLRDVGLVARFRRHGHGRLAGFLCPSRAVHPATLSDLRAGGLRQGRPTLRQGA